MRISLALFYAAFSLWFLAACFESTEAETPKQNFEYPRRLYFSSDDPDYDSWEGTSFNNRCQRDEQCVVSGCDDSACAAEMIEIDDEEFCEWRMMAQATTVLFRRCGCIDQECRWYFENDFDRDCKTDDDCDGLGFPPDGARKTYWACRGGSCHFGEPTEG